MKRTSTIVRKEPDTARLTVKAKKCRACRSPFFPVSAWQSHCRAEACAIAAADEAMSKRLKTQRRETQQERKADRAKREALKTISQIEDECRVIVQKIARIRDRFDGCISCHMGANYEGQWHGSHYRAHGGCSSLQLHLWNIHKACAQCNLHKSGNKEGFILGLLAKPGYGRERLEWLDSQPKSQRFSREYLASFKRVMGKRCRRLEASAKRGRGEAPAPQPSNDSGAYLGACIL